MPVIQRFSKLRLLLVKWTFSAFKIKVLGSWHILQTMRIHLKWDWDWQMNVWILQPNLSGCRDNWRVIHRHCLLMCNRRPASADLCAFLVLLCTAMWWDCVVLLSWGILLVLWSPAHPPPLFCPMNTTKLQICSVYCHKEKHRILAFKKPLEADAFQFFNVSQCCFSLVVFMRHADIWLHETFW